MEKNLEIAEKVLEYIGGKQNVISVFHCATRLRFKLKDKTSVDEKSLKKIDGVLGIKDAGGMYQLIIGQNVEQVYEHLCKIGDLSKEEVINENLDEVNSKKQNISIQIFNDVFTYITKSMSPVIYPLLGAALWNTVGILFGPSVLNLVAADSAFAISCNLMYSALFYFLPMYVGYSAAKALNISNPIWGILLGGILLVPDYVAMSATSTSFNLFGLVTVPVASYAQSIVPVLIGVFVFKYLYDFMKKIIPSMIFGTVAPFIIFFIMSILMLGVFAPLGNWIGTALASLFMMVYTSSFPIKLIGYIALTALWPLLTLAGMHLPIFYAALAVFTVNGSDPFVIACASCSVYVTYGMALGAAFKFKEKEHKANALSAFIAGFFGAVCEPAIYSVALKSKSAMKVMLASGGILGAVLAILQPTWNNFGSGNILGAFVCWAGGAPDNLIKGLAGCGIGLLLGLIGVILFAKFNEDEF